MEPGCTCELKVERFGEIRLGTEWQGRGWKEEASGRRDGRDGQWGKAEKQEGTQHPNVPQVCATVLHSSKDTVTLTLSHEPVPTSRRWMRENVDNRINTWECRWDRLTPHPLHWMGCRVHPKAQPWPPARKTATETHWAPRAGHTESIKWVGNVMFKCNWISELQSLQGRKIASVPFFSLSVSVSGLLEFVASSQLSGICSLLCSFCEENYNVKRKGGGEEHYLLNSLREIIALSLLPLPPWLLWLSSLL